MLKAKYSKLLEQITGLFFVPKQLSLALPSYLCFLQKTEYKHDLSKIKNFIFSHEIKSAKYDKFSSYRYF